MRLAMKPEDIRIGALVRQTEGRPVIVECFDAATNTCRLIGNCRLKGVLADAMNAFYETLDKQTLRDLIAGAPGARMKQVLMSAAGG